MGKLLFSIICTLLFYTYSFGQEFTYAELINARKENYPAFESMAHQKGYKLSHLESNERCSVFTNGSNFLSYYTYYDGFGMKFKSRTAVKFETYGLDYYEKIKEQVEATIKYSGTKVRKYTNKEYLEHIYRNDDISVHLFDINYKNDNKPYYMIEIYAAFND